MNMTELLKTSDFCIENIGCLYYNKKL